MTVKIKEMLPIGSIVRLRDGEKRLMIAGIKQTDAAGDNREYDYLGLLYPEGHIGDEFQYLFNHEDIEELLFRGFEDSEREAFLSRLSALYKETDE